jgi:uncharacterized membrane protein
MLNHVMSIIIILHFMFGVLLNLVIFVKMIGQIIRKYKTIDMSIIIGVMMRLFIKYMYIKISLLLVIKMS